MIELTQGNILKADAEALVNTVNCVGFMGKGIALQFKKAYQRISTPTTKRVPPAKSSRAACSSSNCIPC